MDKLGLIPEIAPRYRATYFNHILSGYAAFAFWLNVQYGIFLESRMCG